MREAVPGLNPAEPKAGTRERAVSLQVNLPLDLRSRFSAWAREYGGASAVLRAFMLHAVGEGEGGQEWPSHTSASAMAVKLSLREAEGAALVAAAGQRGMTPAVYARSVLLTHLTAKPQWSREELEALRDYGEATRQVASLVGSMEGDAAAAAADALLEALNRRLIAAVTGNIAYWAKGQEVMEPSAKVPA